MELGLALLVRCGPFEVTLWLEAGPSLKPSVGVQIQIPREGSVPAVPSVLTLCMRRINPAQRPRPGHTHSVPERVRSDRVFGGQRTAAEDDEDEDEVSEDVMVDQGVTAHTDPGGHTRITALVTLDQFGPAQLEAF